MCANAMLFVNPSAHPLEAFNFCFIGTVQIFSNKNIALVTENVWPFTYLSSFFTGQKSKV